MKLPNGYGSVIKLTGTRRKPWAVRVSYISAEPGQEPKRKQKYLAYFTDQKHALEYLAEYNQGHILKEHEKYADAPTFAELYAKWEKYRRSLPNHPSEETWKNYHIAFHDFAPLHEKKAFSIRAMELQDIINAYSNRSISTIGSMRAMLRGMWSYGVTNEYLEKDITQSLVFQSTYESVPIHTRFTDHEIQALWNALGTINNVDIVLMYIYTGMRPSELLDMRSEDIHLKERYMIGGSKTEAGRNRIIPIHEALVPLIQFRLNQRRDYLISNKYGNHYTRNVYQGSNWKVVMERMNMNHVPHDGRYTFASLADAVSMNETCRKIIMGHSLANKTGTAFKTGGSSDVTQDVYTEKTLEQLLTEINKLPTVFE